MRTCLKTVKLNIDYVVYRCNQLSINHLKWEYFFIVHMLNNHLGFSNRLMFCETKLPYLSLFIRCIARSFKSGGPA